MRKKVTVTTAPKTKNDVSARERRCIASGEVLPDAALIRFVAGPDGEVVADLTAKLPGRGMWVRAERDALALAARKNLFARSAKAPVKVPADLEDQVAAGLLRRLREGLGLAARAGQLTTGFEKVREGLKSGQSALLIEARDGAADGREKVFALAHGKKGAIPVLGCLDSADLDLALGRSNVVHAAVSAGPMADRLLFDMARLAGFRPLAPADWRLPGVEK